jgi:acyl-CoA hydrolase
MNDNVLAINNAIEIDLFIQVSSESTVPGKTPGLEDSSTFIHGAFGQHGGKALICLARPYG